MKKPSKRILIGGVVVAAAVATGGAAVATSADDETGSTDYTPQEKAAAISAALDATDGGRANSVERDSEDGATWEVEVTRTDGSTVDVRLDEALDVVVIEGDTEDEPGDSDSDD